MKDKAAFELPETRTPYVIERPVLYIKAEEILSWNSLVESTDRTVIGTREKSKRGKERTCTTEVSALPPLFVFHFVNAMDKSCTEWLRVYHLQSPSWYLQNNFYAMIKK